MDQKLIATFTKQEFKHFVFCLSKFTKKIGQDDQIEVKNGILLILDMGGLISVDFKKNFENNCFNITDPRKIAKCLKLLVNKTSVEIYETTDTYIINSGRSGASFKKPKNIVSILKNDYLNDFRLMDVVSLNKDDIIQYFTEYDVKNSRYYYITLDSDNNKFLNIHTDLIFIDFFGTQKNKNFTRYKVRDLFILRTHLKDVSIEIYKNENNDEIKMRIIYKINGFLITFTMMSLKERN
jgi:hypothetical protein